MTDLPTPPGDEDEDEANPRYRPAERFWPYVDVPEDPTAQELSTLDSELFRALFGPQHHEFSITLSFPPFASDEYAKAVELATRAPEYRTVGVGTEMRHRARFYSDDARQLHELFEIVGSYDQCDVLINERPVPFARELWLPLVWLLNWG